MLDAWNESAWNKSVGLQLSGLNGTRYRLEKLHGVGGHSVVFDATEMESRDRVAVKIRNPMSLIPISSFRREIEILTVQRHPHLIRGIDEVRDDQRQLWGLVLEFAPESLHDRTQISGALSWEQYLPILRAVLNSLAFLHSRSLVHRDVSPRNIVFAESAPTVAKLADLGIAYHSSDLPITADQKTLGTPGFLSPACRWRVPDSSFDFFALAVTSFLALTREAPFSSRDREFREPRDLGVLYQQVHGTPLVRPAAECVARMLDGDAQISAEQLLSMLNRQAAPQTLALAIDTENCRSSASSLDACAWFLPPCGDSTDEIVELCGSQRGRLLVSEPEVGRSSDSEHGRPTESIQQPKANQSRIRTGAAMAACAAVLAVACYSCWPASERITLAPINYDSCKPAGDGPLPKASRVESEAQLAIAKEASDEPRAQPNVPECKALRERHAQIRLKRSAYFDLRTQSELQNYYVVATSHHDNGDLASHVSVTYLETDGAGNITRSEFLNPDREQGASIARVSRDQEGAPEIAMSLENWSKASSDPTKRRLILRVNIDTFEYLKRQHGSQTHEVLAFVPHPLGAELASNALSMWMRNQGARFLGPMMLF